MFTPEQLEAMPLAIERQFRELESRIMLDIVRRLKINSEITSSAGWQLQRLSEIGASKKAVKAYIQSTLRLSDKEVDNLYKNAVASGYVADKALYTAVGKDFIPYGENKQLQQLVTAVTKQTKGDFKNITQSLGFAVRQPNGQLAFKPIANYYQTTLDKAALDITSGAFGYNTVLKRTVKEMTNSGLRTVDYASGHSNRIDVAVRRAVMTGVNQVTAKITEDNMKALETGYVEVSWHRGARPSHQEWQGKRFYWAEKAGDTSSEYPDFIIGTGYGTGAGLCGWNCYHTFYAVSEMSAPTYTEEQLKELNRQENTPKGYNGKQYTAYEATQRQRKLETIMRAQRKQITLLKEGGANKADITSARAKYSGTSAEYAKFSKSMGLPQQRERVTIDGLGRV